jgi:predicted PurR-regulated permease PerM
MVFLALWFAGWLWGIAGIVIAIPSLVSLKVVAQRSMHSKPLSELLSPEAEASAASRAEPRTLPAAVLQRSQ